MGILDFLEKQVKKGAYNLVRDVGNEITHKINVEASRIQRRMVKELSSLVILLTAVVFLAIAAIYFFIEYLSLNKTVSFLIVGIVLLFVGIIIRIIK